MPIPTKADCTAIAAQVNTAQRVADNVGQILEGNASRGTIGGTIPYGPLGAGAVTVLQTTLQNRGWTVTRDDVNSKLDVS